MKFTLTATALAAALPALAMPGVAPRTPQGSGSGNCKDSFDGTFEFTIVELNKRSLQTRADCSNSEGALILTLQNGILKDAKGRTGYIAANFQFQFDEPVQAGTLKDSGFAVCDNGLLTLTGESTWFQCLSGTFYNLYDRNWAAQCSGVQIMVMPCGGASSGGGGGSEGGGQMPDGQVVGTSMMATTLVTVLPDGQPQVVPTMVPIPVCQIGDGQIQAHTTPCAAKPPPVSQISDGQIQVPTAMPAPPAPPVSQISDGQIQVPTAPPAPPVTQISDGQIQVPTAPPPAPPAPPVTQISDGQIQVPTAAPPAPPVTQISDGQIQVPTGAPVTQISDGQIQVPTSMPSNATKPTATFVPAAGHRDAAANGLGLGFAAGLAGVVAMLL